MIYVVIGAIIGGFEIYNHMRLKRIEDEIACLPTPEEVAKEVMKVKMPLSALPPDMAESIRQQMKALPPQAKGSTKTPSNIYIG